MPRKNRTFRAPLKLLLLAGVVVISVYGTLPALTYFYKVPDVALPPAVLKPTQVSTSQILLPLSAISKSMQDSMIAAEDRRFYQHHGIDALGAVRAILSNIRAGHMVEGGSTLTQQLAKTIFLDYREQTANRKIQQIVMAWELESRYDKSRIFEAYLNDVYFGNGAYGIELASQKYFGLHAKELDYAHGAFLSGLVQAPSEYSLPSKRSIAISRQQEILHKLFDYGYITNDTLEWSLTEKLKFKDFRAKAKAQ